MVRKNQRDDRGSFRISRRLALLPTPSSSILLTGPNDPTLTRAHVHVRHINYNDFLPLMLERDLNYRYSLHGLRRGGGARKEKEREREKQSEMRQLKGPAGASAVITGCA